MRTEETQKFTFRDLKNEVNKLSDEQLDYPVYVSRESESLKIQALWIVEHDLFHRINDPEDCGTIDELKDLHGDDFEEDQYVPGSKKGTPFLAEDF